MPCMPDHTILQDEQAAPNFLPNLTQAAINTEAYVHKSSATQQIACGVYLHCCLGMFTGGVPLLFAQLEQLLQLLLHVAICLAQLGNPLELPHLGYSTGHRVQGLGFWSP